MVFFLGEKNGPIVFGVGDDPEILWSFGSGRNMVVLF
jgi:hypothetical protein